MLFINGEEHPEAMGQSLASYLTAHGYAPERVAVERNCAIVPKSQFSTTTLQDGDQVEIVQFVGGG